MKISFVNFWEKTPPWLVKFFKINICDDTSVVELNENPDILFASCMGDINKVINSTAKIKIFYYGENLNVYKNRYDYSDFQKLKEHFDLIVGFKYTDLTNKIVRFPLWFLYYPYYNYDERDNVLKYLQNSYNENSIKKINAASLISRHGGYNNQRGQIYDEMIKYVKVYCPSDFKRNMKNIGPSSADKINFLKLTAYNICPENSNYEGYHTEKIFEALEGGCIPIYSAIEIPEKDIINEKCYCFIDLNKEGDLEKKIKHVIENYSEYFQTEIFKKDAGLVIKKYYDTFINEIKKLIKEKI